jgi:hypothetical protein
MRKLVVKFGAVMILLMGALAPVAAPAQAGSGDPFVPPDGRSNPLTADRLAIYCNNDNVDVWGIDGDNVGFRLSTFSLAELEGSAAVSHQTPNGVVTLKLDRPAQVEWDYPNYSATTLSRFTDVSAEYHVSWSGGTMGANGKGAFYKVFDCTYLP